MKTADLFVKALENEGVEYIFGIPGEENLDFLDALQHSSIKLIVTRHEQGAGFMAANYGRLTGKPGVCLSTLGPGATNLVTPAAYAQLGGMPMLIITGQKPIKASKQALFQIIDTVNMMRPITKFTKQVVHGNTVAAIVREAFRIAVEERPGAVHIELPEDIAAEEASERIYTVENIRRPDADNTAIKQAIEMISSATMPLVLIGAGANRKRASKALTRFVEKTGIPFFNTQLGKGVIDERHDSYLGTAALSESDFLHCAIDRADLIINVGHDEVEKPPFFMSDGGAKVIHINFNAAEVDPVYFPQLDVIGDIATSINRLTDKLTPQPHWDFSYYYRVKQEVQERLSHYSEDDRFPVLPQAAVATIRRCMGEQDILALDNGIYKVWFARNYPCYDNNTLLLDNALATMGAGLPTAMMAKLHHPERKVMAVCGDGGFMMNSQELETAVRLGLDLVVVIFNDNGFGMIKWKQQGMGFKDFGLSFGNPDFVKYAESYGAVGHRPESFPEFARILEQSLNSKGVHLIDLAIDYSLNHSILHEGLKQKICIL
ncbi:acetolactate synthase [Methylophaga lonarensis MPL]|uniref:Acetolactate synthase n=1 Tax=Methylophaga lonarensis MPL TaxID=1286106 RepID=M7NYH7_9GAMM|nr:acetolactate synthase large subunit [Methylophaga lonarensis]EMR12267.1 acetolactate synthase [Methylophaga lonarensis MPL]